MTRRLTGNGLIIMQSQVYLALISPVQIITLILMPLEIIGLHENNLCYNTANLFCINKSFFFLQSQQALGT